MHIGRGDLTILDTGFVISILIADIGEFSFDTDK